MILSLDTYSDILGITILEKENIIYRLSLYKLKPFSEVLVSKLDEIFKELSIKKRDLKAVIVNKGPGSYTGLRVGISTAKTIAYTLNIDIYAYSSLSVLAFKYRYIDGNVAVCINAGKNEVYFQEFYVSKDNIKPLSEIKLIKQKELLNHIKKETKYLIGKNINFDYDNLISDMEDLSLYGALYSLENNLKEDIFKLEPIYIRGL